MYKNLVAQIRSFVVYSIFKTELNTGAPVPAPKRQLREMGPAKTSDQSQGLDSGKMKDAAGRKVGRNDPCPCGSCKKYKKCHGANI